MHAADRLLLGQLRSGDAHLRDGRVRRGRRSVRRKRGLLLEQLRQQRVRCELRG
jgi:hypothetical protein